MGSKRAREDCLKAHFPEHEDDDSDAPLSSLVKVGGLFEILSKTSRNPWHRAFSKLQMVKTKSFSALKDLKSL